MLVVVRLLPWSRFSNSKSTRTGPAKKPDKAASPPLRSPPRQPSWASRARFLLPPDLIISTQPPSPHRCNEQQSCTGAEVHTPSFSTSSNNSLSPPVGTPNSLLAEPPRCLHVQHCRTTPHRPFAQLQLASVSWLRKLYSSCTRPHSMTLPPSYSQVSLCATSAFLRSRPPTDATLPSRETRRNQARDTESRVLHSLPRPHRHKLGGHFELEAPLLSPRLGHLLRFAAYPAGPVSLKQHRQRSCISFEPPTLLKGELARQ